MASKKRDDRIGALISEVEAVAKRLRTDIRQRAKATGLPKNLQRLADQLRKRAAAVAAQVEKYAHEIRKELEKGSKPARRPRPRKPKTVAAG